MRARTHSADQRCLISSRLPVLVVALLKAVAAATSHYAAGMMHASSGVRGMNGPLFLIARGLVLFVAGAGPCTSFFSCMQSAEEVLRSHDVSV